MDYGCIVWGDSGKQNALNLERLTTIVIKTNNICCAYLEIVGFPIGHAY